MKQFLVDSGIVYQHSCFYMLKKKRNYRDRYLPEKTQRNI